MIQKNVTEKTIRLFGLSLSQSFDCICYSIWDVNFSEFKEIAACFLILFIWLKRKTQF